MINVPSMQDLLSAGVHFGHKVSRGHPKMGQFIYEARDGVHIIDLAKSETKLKEAVEFAQNLGKNGGVLLLVGTKKQAREIIKSLGEETKTPYIISHWVGGLLTNFDEIKRNLNKLKSLKVAKEGGELSHYTKKERLLIDRRLEKFEQDLGGITDLAKVPEAMFVIDVLVEQTAVKEASRMGISTIAITDTNTDPTPIDYPIPANDDGLKSIKLICETVINAYAKGKKEAGEKLKAMEAREEKAKQKEMGQKEVDEAVLDEAADLEEKIEKEVVEESERKVE